MNMNSISCMNMNGMSYGPSRGTSNDLLHRVK